MDQKDRAAQVAQQNDAFRQWWINREGRLLIPGRALLTSGVQELLLARHRETQDLLTLIGTFDDFGEDNDPWGERDFGAFNFEGERLFWKIDLYDPTQTKGTEDATDITQTYRVMTIMLASEY